MINLKLILTSIVSFITIWLIYESHDSEKPIYLWVFAIITTFLTLSIIIYDRFKELKIEVTSKKTVSPLVRGLIEYNALWFNMMAVEGGISELKYNDHSDKDLNTILCRIYPNGNSPIVAVNEGNRKLRWTEFLFQLCLQTNQRIDNIYPHIINLDSQLIKNLSDIKNNYLLKEMQIQSNINVGNSDLVYEEKQISSYFKKISDLNKYYENNLKKFDNSEIQNAWTPYLGK